MLANRLPNRNELYLEESIGGKLYLLRDTGFDFFFKHDSLRIY